jgi:hypothetical protein
MNTPETVIADVGCAAYAQTIGGIVKEIRTDAFVFHGDLSQTLKDYEANTPVKCRHLAGAYKQLNYRRGLLRQHKKNETARIHSAVLSGETPLTPQAC